MGVTFGAPIWIGALVGTLVCFGLPIAWAQRAAKKGLAGEERGESIVGLACVALSLMGFLLTLGGADLQYVHHGSLSIWMARAFAALGGLAGGASASLAFARAARRRRFVKDAEAGKIAGYRVDPTMEGKVLVRVVAQGQGYRVADFEEDVFEISAEREAVQAQRVQG
jgi:hypothetical protein